MEYTEDALVLKTVNYGESDRMITLLTAGRGKIGAAVKGVRKVGAKLNFAAQPFCFAEYTLAERRERNTVISASLYEGFYALREDMQRFYAGATVLETCDKLLVEAMPAEDFLIAAVEALKELCAGGEYATLKFLLRALALAGYSFSAPEEGAERFDFESGTFSDAGVAVSASTVQTLRHCFGLSGTPSRDGLKRALRLLRSFFGERSYELHSVNELLQIL